MKVMVTGSSGLIGSEIAVFFARQGWQVHGVDNNQRAVFFGQDGDTRWNQVRLQSVIPKFVHHEVDIRDRERIRELIEAERPDAIVHAAAQPSHDRAQAIPFDDFDTNATGTLNLLEANRRSCPESPFILMSSNKVYGDGPNRIALVEHERRWDFADEPFLDGISETFPIDQCLHSLFGVSKTAADLLVQEYGRYFGMPTCCLRGGCLTGPNHSGVELHGFLSYLVRCNLESREYRVLGYGGKQVRDNIHSRDVASFIWEFVQAPRSAAVYNIGGGRENSCSILEAFSKVGSITGREQLWTYVEENRIGDHICYYSNLAKAREHYPSWEITVPLDNALQEIVGAWRNRLGQA